MNKEKLFIAMPMYNDEAGFAFAEAVKTAETWGNTLDGKSRKVGIYKLVGVVENKVESKFVPLEDA